MALDDATLFPADDSLCESCGYSLRGLTVAGNCPECGRAVSDSAPARRTGLPWQNRATIGSWLATTWMVATRPREAFRVMRINRPAAGWRELGYMVSIALLIPAFSIVLAVGGALFADMTGRARSGAVMTFSGSNIWPAMAAAIPVLVVVEALGVAWVAWRRGWRIPFRLSLAITCYASVGWIPSAIVNVVVHLWYTRKIDLGWYPFPDTHVDYIILMVLFMVSVLGFETLVWIGAKQTRFGNAG